MSKVNLNTSKSNQFRKAGQVRAMRKAFNLVRKRQKANVRRISDLEGRKKRLRRARKYGVGNEDLLSQAVRNLRQNGIKVYLPRSLEEAISMAVSEIGDDKLVVKSKSNLTKEIGLTSALEEIGINVVETDIGDRILQLCGDLPSHPTGPASHLTKHDISEILSLHFKRRVEPSPEMIVELLRGDISDYINASKIGITGANAIAAEEGAVLLVHNEGNIIEVATRPEKHIILAGIDKIYRNIEEAINMLKLQTYYATGSLASSFINIVSGPSQTADIEKQLIRGVHGPKELYLILVDNHRRDIARSEYRDLLYCIGCGQCLLVCPAYAIYGREFSADGHLGGRGLVYCALNDKYSVEGSKGLYRCLSCRKCQKNCPVGIDIPSMIVKLRLEKHERALNPRLQTTYDFLAAHIEWIGTGLWIEALGLAQKLLPKTDK